MKIFKLLLIIFILVTGCSTQVPLLEKKQINDYQIVINDAQVTYVWPSPDWWKKYKNSDLNELIEYAIVKSPNIDIARARFLSAVANIKKVNPSSKLDIDLLTKFNGNYASRNSDILKPFAGKWRKEFSFGLSLNYQLDIWGVNKGLLNSATAIAKSQGANIENAKLLIVSTIVQNYFIMQLHFVKLNLLQQQLDILHEILTYNQKTLNLGINDTEHIIKIEEYINNIQAQVSIIQSDINIQKNILISLVGGNELFINNLTLKPIPSIKISIPENLNYEFLFRRADLQAQKWLVESSIGLVAASKAAFYPTFNLTGFAGFSSINIKHLLSLPSKQFNVVPSLYLPIFNTGMLKAQLLFSKANQNEAIANYNAAIINAIKDVNIAVININTVNEQIQFAKNNFNFSKQLLNNTTNQCKLGVVSEIEVLNARMDIVNKQNDLTTLIYQRILNDVDLIKALGGGYSIN